MVLANRQRRRVLPRERCRAQVPPPQTRYFNENHSIVGRGI